jgi:polar amino acid transport system permease protein
MEFDWGYFFSLFSVGAFWQACVTVIVVSSLSWFIGLVLGFLLACAKLSGPRWLKVPVELYIWFFRSVPLMVLLVFVYNLPQLFPATQPLLGIPFIAGLVSMTVTEAAYMAEIHRGGLMSVERTKRSRPRIKFQLYWHSALNYYSAGVSYFVTYAD